MKLKIVDDRTLQFDEAQLIFKNFSGAAKEYNKEGDKNFAIKIDPEFVAQLQNSKNKEGIGWNVKTFTPKADPQNPNKDLTPINYLKVKIGKGDIPIQIELDGNIDRCVDMNVLDSLYIEKADIDISAYDSVVMGKSYRSAYLKGMKVYAKAKSRFDTLPEQNNTASAEAVNEATGYENLGNVEEVPF